MGPCRLALPSGRRAGGNVSNVRSLTLFQQQSARC